MTRYSRLQLKFSRAPQEAALLVITIYQKTLSPDHGLFKLFFPGGICRFRPTCSEYMKDAICLHGWRGLLYGIKRIGRCHPWSEGGHDPVRRHY